MSGVQGFHHLAMRVKNFDASVRFYTEGIGLEQTMAWGEGDSRATMLHIGGGSHLELFAGGSDEPKSEGALLHFALATDDCDGMYARALAAGAAVHMEPRTLTIESTPQPKTVRIAFVKGLDGEVMEFFQVL